MLGTERESVNGTEVTTARQINERNGDVATVRFSALDCPTYAVSEAAFSCVWCGASIYTVPPLHGGTNPCEMVHLQSRTFLASTSFLAKCLSSTCAVSA